MIYEQTFYLGFLIIGILIGCLFTIALLSDIKHADGFVILSGVMLIISVPLALAKEEGNS